jgi:hypothetical protein
VILLGADTASDCGQHIVFADLGCCSEEITGDNQLHELLDLHTHRAIICASGFGTLQAAHCLLAGQFGRVTKVDLGKVRRTQLGRLLGHVLPRNLHPLFQRQRIQRR